MHEDTIAAIATPLGEGALAIVRVSGPEALRIADRCFRAVGKGAGKPSAASTHTIHFGHIVRDGRRIDEVLLSVMRAPRTFTREDVIELACHGGVVPAKAVLDTVLRAGARLAQPGEFTRRAFLNGRIDLAQAEAVIDVIHSRTELALRAAGDQLAGVLSVRIKRLRDDVMHTLAHIEAHIDFPEEDIDPRTGAGLIADLEKAMGSIDELLKTAGEGRILRRGIRAAIVGRPNAGKSSLLNRLLGEERAIVSTTPGTTRDTIEETANVRGLPILFIDTAGLRDVEDDVEAEGVRRSRDALARAELVLHIIDHSEPLSDTDRKLLDELPNKKRIVVKNKTDLRSSLVLPEKAERKVVGVSCATGAGVEELKDAIVDLIWSGRIDAEMLPATINSRHEDALNRARFSVIHSIEALRNGLPLELAAMELRSAANAVGEIVGQTATEDLLDIIFSQFCIGK